MGQVGIPPRAIIFTGIIRNPVQEKEAVYQTLQDLFGKIILKSAPFSFEETDYYTQEMGGELVREYVGFDCLINMDDITKIKLKTNRIERNIFLENGKRLVNIDPGYATSGKVVLATTKDYQHRIYLKDGIYAEVTLCYRKGDFVPWGWTYPDYRRKESLEFFTKLRAVYRNKIRKENLQ
ncbi:MAG: DUF4416 family protein [Spirochaetota bacterium]